MFPCSCVRCLQRQPGIYPMKPHNQRVYLKAVALWSVSLVSGPGLAPRPEPVWRGDRLAAVQLGGADVWRPHPAAGQRTRVQLAGWTWTGALKTVVMWRSCAGRPSVSLRYQRGDGPAQPLPELQDPSGLRGPLRRRRRLQTHRLPQTGNFLFLELASVSIFGIIFWITNKQISGDTTYSRINNMRKQDLPIVIYRSLCPLL